MPTQASTKIRRHKHTGVTHASARFPEARPWECALDAAMNVESLVIFRQLEDICVLHISARHSPPKRLKGCQVASYVCDSRLGILSHTISRAALRCGERRRAASDKKLSSCFLAPRAYHHSSKAAPATDLPGEHTMLFSPASQPLLSAKYPQSLTGDYRNCQSSRNCRLCGEVISASRCLSDRTAEDC